MHCFLLSRSMMYNKEELYNCIVEELIKRSIKYEVHSFDSGTFMIDIWHRNSFYVIQVEEASVGLSEIQGENVAFDLVPDIVFHDNELFFTKLKEVLNKVS